METAFDLDTAETRHAERLHQEGIFVDGLVPTTDYINDSEYQGHLAAGGVTAGNFTVASRTNYPDATRRLQRCLDIIAQNRDAFSVVETVADVRAANEQDRVGAILGFQDTMPIAPVDRMQTDGGLEFLRAFHQMGVRIVQLTYNSLNYVGAGCCEPTDPGVSESGRSIIEEMNRLGVLIDLSHCGDQTTLDAIKHSEDPVVFSHADARALSGIKRNKTDEQIRAVADSGGLIGVSVFPPTVKTDTETYEVQRATVHDVLDHIDHVVDLIGVDHVAFGSDMNDKALDNGVTPPYAAYRNFRPSYLEVYGRGPIETYEPFPKGIHGHTELVNLMKGLVARGYSDKEVRKILGENFLRVFAEVWDDDASSP